MKIIALLVTLLMVLASTAEAQSSTPTTTANPRPVVMPVTPIVQNGITGSVQWEGAPVMGASVIVSLVRQDTSSWVYFVDRATSKRFGPCKSKLGVNCVRSSGTYTITDAELPQGDVGVGRDLDVRAEAPQYYHDLGYPVRAFVDGSYMVWVSPVNLFKIWTIVDEPHVQWIDEKTLSVGVWMRNEYWAEEVIVDFSFSGSSWTKAEVKYPTISSSEFVDTQWQWVERWFSVPQTGTAYYGGTICGELQVRSIWSNEVIFEQTKKVCTPLPPPPCPEGFTCGPTGGGGGGGSEVLPKDYRK